MGYDRSFYNAYHKYLKEWGVRRAHDSVLSLTRLDPALSNVVDLGCGQFNEYLHYRRPSHYVGIDVNVDARQTKTRRLVAADYRSLSTASGLAKEHGATGFVSLFSSEITAPFETNYRYYKQLFRAVPDLQAGLVSGFYYWTKKDKNPIGEAGGIQSYQTLEPLEAVLNNVFYETRIILPCPSNMFGRDVIEVWKLFRRK